jgi:FK506-binding protein 14
MDKLLFVSLALVFFATLVHSEKDKLKVDAQPGDEKFDGVGIGLVERPRTCKKTTRKGDLVRVTFNVSIGDGKAFETRYEKEPLEFVIGDGEMIGGFDVGLQDMCVGEIRHLTVPPQYGYGSNGMGNLPSRVNLYFFVKMVSFTSVPPQEQVKSNTFKKIDIDNDLHLSQDEVRAYLAETGVPDKLGDGGQKQMIRDIFREEDRNGNGFIDHMEFSGVKRDEL